MEEWVGQIWHKVISHSADTGNVNNRVFLSEIDGQLSTFFRGLGGGLVKP